MTKTFKERWTMELNFDVKGKVEEVVEKLGEMQIENAMVYGRTPPS